MLREGGREHKGRIFWVQFLSFGGFVFTRKHSVPVTRGRVRLSHGKGAALATGKNAIVVRLFFFFKFCGSISRKSLILVNWVY